MTTKVISSPEQQHAASKKRTKVKAATQTRKFSFQFFFYEGEKKVQVCRQFYLRTLDISASI